MLHAGDRIALTIERPAAGGRMIARHDGQIVLVSATIPGERVVAQVERVERRLAFASTVEVLEPSPDRRSELVDALCGGCLYAHIALARQREIKAAVVADALFRIGRHSLDHPVDVAPSPEHGYRLRARLHVRDGRIGFYREGTHDLCDASATGQLRSEALAVAARAVAALGAVGAVTRSIELAESVAGDQRALRIELVEGGQLSPEMLAQEIGDDLTSLTAAAPGGPAVAAGAEAIVDPLGALTGGRAYGELRRSTSSFFQSNRFLVGALVQAVTESVVPEGEVLDLYAGVGLFALAIAGAGRAGVTAVEGEPSSGLDLRRNAAACATTMTALVSPVEHYLARVRHLPPTVIVDPPRTGLSPPVLAALTSRGGATIIYVSCDPATLARDARRLLEHGYALSALQAFDLFPNTPHVETVTVFER